MKRIDALVSTWLLTIITLIIILIILGGVTRMKLAGLSIVEWKPVLGFIPPLNDSDWREELLKYQSTTQYKTLYTNLSFEDFKSIFYLEYFHRLLARLIGILVFIPIFFKKTRKIALTGGVMILLQGTIGWWMVASGLQDRIAVKPLRLSIHLIAALITLSYFYWKKLRLRTNKQIEMKQNHGWLLILLSILLLLQIFFGGLSSGTHAGFYYPTFPLMNGELIPDGVIPFHFSDLVSDEPLLAQWLHRLVGTVLLFIAGLLLYFKRKGAVIFLLILFVQYLLGITMVLNASPFLLRVLHQFVAIFTILSALRMFFGQTSAKTMI